MLNLDGSKRGGNNCNNSLSVAVHSGGCSWGSSPLCTTEPSTVMAFGAARPRIRENGRYLPAL